MQAREAQGPSAPCPLVAAVKEGVAVEAEAQAPPRPWVAEEPAVEAEVARQAQEPSSLAQLRVRLPWALRLVPEREQQAREPLAASSYHV